MFKILQGLGVAQAAVTERWLEKEEKSPENHFLNKWTKCSNFSKTIILIKYQEIVMMK